MVHPNKPTWYGFQIIRTRIAETSGETSDSPASLTASGHSAMQEGHNRSPKTNKRKAAGASTRGTDTPEVDHNWHSHADAFPGSIQANAGAGQNLR